MLLLLSLLLPGAHAQDADFKDFAPAGTPVETPETSITAEAGGSLTTGNTGALTASGGLHASHKVDKLRYSGNASLVYGESAVDKDGDGLLSDEELSEDWVQNAFRFTADSRFDYFVAKKASLYAFIGVLHDEFAGFVARPNQQLGFSYVAVDIKPDPPPPAPDPCASEEDKAKAAAEAVANPPEKRRTRATRLAVEVAFDIAEEFLVDDPETGLTPDPVVVPAARAGVDFTHKFNDKVGLTNHAEAFFNVTDSADIRVINTFAFNATISDNLGLRLSHKLLFDNQPVEGFRPLDQTTTATLVFTLL